jgi:hypothetical protein
MNTLAIEAAVKPLLEEALRLEKEAKECRALAREYEEKLAKISGSTNGNGHIPVANSHVTLDQLISAIRRKGGRVTHYAQRLQTTPLVIQKLIDQPNSGIKIGQKGWIELAKTNL